MRSYKLDNETLIQVSAERDAGASWQYLSEKFGLSRAGLRDLVARWKVKPEPTPRGRKTYKLNEDAFTEISEESAYWTGILMADGSIEYNPGWKNVVHLYLKLSDHDHIGKFKDFTGYSGPLVYRKPTTHMMGKQITSEGLCGLRLNSLKMCIDLMKYGVIPKKSATAEVLLLEKNRHFWRGVIDGDGSIGSYRSTSKLGYTRTTWSITLCGSKRLAEQFGNFCNYFCEARPSVLKQRSIFTISYSGESAARVVRELYRDNTISLARKQEKVNELMSAYSDKLFPELLPESTGSQLLYKYRKLFRVKQAEIAKMFGVSRPTVSEWENEVRQPPNEVTERISKLIQKNP